MCGRLSLVPVRVQGHELQHPSHALLEEQGFDKVTYSTYRERCLADRTDLGAHLGRPQCLHAAMTSHLQRSSALPCLQLHLSTAGVGTAGLTAEVLRISTSPRACTSDVVTCAQASATATR